MIIFWNLHILARCIRKAADPNAFPQMQWLLQLMWNLGYVLHTCICTYRSIPNFKLIYWSHFVNIKTQYTFTVSSMIEVKLVCLHWCRTWWLWARTQRLIQQPWFWSRKYLLLDCSLVKWSSGSLQGRTSNITYKPEKTDQTSTSIPSSLVQSIK